MTSHTGFAQQPADRSSPASGYVGFAFVAALAAVGCYFAVTVYQSEVAQRAANSMTPDQINAQFAAMTGPERTAKLDELRAELAAEPLDRRVLFEISLLLALEGDSKSAEQLTLVAAGRSLREPAVLGQALNILLQRGDAEKSLAVIDGLIRARPKLADTLFDQILLIAENPKWEGMVAKLLSANPPWRERLFLRAAANDKDSQKMYRLLLSLKSNGTSVNDTELRMLLSKMLTERNYAQAYFVWLDMLQDPGLQYVGNVYDGGFESKPRNLYFDWFINRTQTVEVKTMPRATGSADHVLRVDYIGNRTRIAPAYQFLQLNPGEYIFSGDQRSDGLKTDSGINWLLYCVGPNGVALTNSPKLSGTTQWTRFDVRFVVAPGCHTQQLALTAASRAVLDQQISGSAMFDNIQIQTVAAAQQENP